MNINKSKLIQEIKQKRELEGISDNIVSESLDRYIEKNSIDLDRLTNFDIKLVIKDIRAELRKYSGMFRLSAKERISFYPILKKEIFKLNPKSILDLGCGTNPIFLASPKIIYYASDINEGDLAKIRKHFEKNKINGKVFFFDLRKISEDSNLPEADLCLIMKVFDVLEKRGHKLAEKIIKNVKCKYFIISFPTKTLSGAPMNHPQRGWIERLLARIGFKFKTFKSNNEIFYLAEKIA